MDANTKLSSRLGIYSRLMWENRKDIDWSGQKSRIAFTTSVVLLQEPFSLAERAAYASRIRNTEVTKPPIFILGHWRSGTTYLFNLLSQDPDTAYMDTVSTFTFDHFLTFPKTLDKIYDRALSGSRPGDSMDWFADSPQEEVYAMGNMVEASFVHLVNYPQNAEKYMRLNYAENMTPKQRQEWEKAHRYILKKMTYAKGGRRILFKSPDNTGKARMLHELYPDAKFISIYRDPYKVIKSTVNMFIEGCRTQTFEKLPSDEWIEDRAIEQFAMMYQHYFEDIKHIPSNQLVEVAYSDLTKEPMETLQRIYDQLNLPGFEGAKPRFQAHIDSQKNYQVNRFHIDPKLVKKINDQLGFYFEHYGFPMREAEENV